MALRIKPFEPGHRDRIITIESRPAADTVDDEGAPIDGPWTTLSNRIPAARTDVIAREQFRADQLSAMQTTRWEMGYRIDMDPEQLDVPKLRRVVHRGRVYDITSASIIGRLEGIELMTLARVI